MPGVTEMEDMLRLAKTPVESAKIYQLRWARKANLDLCEIFADQSYRLGVRACSRRVAAIDARIREIREEMAEEQRAEEERRAEWDEADWAVYADQMRENDV